MRFSGIFTRPSAVAEPVPIWHAEVYCGAPFTQPGFALTLASTPGASVMLTFPGLPADVSRLIPVV